VQACGQLRREDMYLPWTLDDPKSTAFRCGPEPEPRGEHTEKGHPAHLHSHDDQRNFLSRIPRSPPLPPPSVAPRVPGIIYREVLSALGTVGRAGQSLHDAKAACDTKPGPRDCSNITHVSALMGPHYPRVRHRGGGGRRGVGPFLFMQARPGIR
jgi:hypothetical protein